VQSRTGELAAAEADLRRAIEIASLGGLTLPVPLIRVMLVEVLIERGELAAAEAELDAADVVARFTGYSFWFNLPLAQRGRLRLARGRPREAAELFMDFHASLERHGFSGNPIVPVAGWAARAFAALGEHERARELADEQLAHAARWGAPSAMSEALRAKAVAVGGDEGIELLGQAVATMERSPARLERAHALDELGGALRRANRRAQAREPLREALDLARRCGAAGLAKHADDELQACGERRRRHTPIGPDSLTPSERRVAELAASGMTNRQIAQTLYLTTKTIETHLSAAYDKLGIRSRHQIADALAAPSA
jgi:ATP/maltotriose-dependent transcriptional regulator MalT